MATWQEIKSAVESNGNIKTFPLGDLRDATGKDKLGVHVRSEISSTLAGMGLGHVPQELPNYQHELVRVYKRGTSLGDVIERILTPGESNDITLRESFSDDKIDYAAIIQQIRKLVEE